VTFHYKSDKTDSPQFGLIAEEVANVNPNLVVRDKNGEIYTVRYEAVNAIEELEATVAKLQSVLKEQAAQIQKVSAQLELDKAAPKTVVNNQ
jgi:hypothetical protein